MGTTKPRGEIPIAVPPQPPPLFPTNPSSVHLALQRWTEFSVKVINEIVSQVPLEAATIGNVIGPLAHAENARLAETGILFSLKSTVLDSELREASRNAQNTLSDIDLELWQREDIFRLVDSVRNKIDSGQLPQPDPESRHFLDTIHREFHENGLSLTAKAPRERLAAIQRRIDNLSDQFSTNLDEQQTTGMWFKPGELEGVPDHVLSNMEKRRDDDEEEMFVDFLCDSAWLLACGVRPESRRRLYLAMENSCNKNSPIFKETALLRDEAARLLGYPSHAAMVVQHKMAGNTQVVHRFLEGVRDAVQPRARAEVERLKELKASDTKAGTDTTVDDHFYLWDVSYYLWQLRQKNQEDGIDLKTVSEYFPLQHTLSKMLETMGGLFGMIFTKVDTTAENIWHEDVQLYSVWDTEEEGGDFVGYLYLDLFVRDFKPQGPTCRNLVPGYLRPDGSRAYPSTALLCPFIKPRGGNPCLLSHSQATQLFHELGHGVHNLVSKTAYARFHGAAGTVVDFGEAPSQLLENWLREPALVKRFARHYSSLSEEYHLHWQQKQTTSPAPPPPDPELPENVIISLLKYFAQSRGILYLDDVHRSSWDFSIHDPPSRESLQVMDLSESYCHLKREIYPLETPWHQGEGDRWGHAYTKFRNMICGDYHAGYYGYLLSEMYATDIWETFFKADPDCKDAWRRYRRMLLEKGGSRPEMETLRGYLGREPDPGPFYKGLGPPTWPRQSSSRYLSGGS